MKIYIDDEKKCHTTNPNNSFREFDILEFDGKCKEYIEGHIYCPDGESYTRNDGKVFHGECLTAWKPYSELDAAQRKYELQQLADYKAACERMGIVV